MLRLWIIFGGGLLIESVLALWAWSGWLGNAPAIVHFIHFPGLLIAALSGLPSWVGMLLSFGINAYFFISVLGRCLRD